MTTRPKPGTKGNENASIVPLPGGPATITQVAREAGVSIATVSRVLNRTGPVRESTRTRVQEVAARLAYVPHAAARSLSSRRTRTVGVILPDIHGEFFSELLRGMDAVCRDAGFHLLVSGFHSDRRDLSEILQTTRGRVDGIALMWPELEAEHLRNALPPNLPVVLLNCRLEGSDCAAIEIDNRGGARAVAHHLLALGHRRLAVVGGPPHNRDAWERVEAFRDEVTARGGRGAEVLVLEGDFSEGSGHRAGLRLVAHRFRPTAVFAANDSMALGVLRALRESGVEVPGGMALVGFDDIPTARYVSPPLTSVNLFVADLGRRAMECLVGRVEGAPAQAPVVETRPAELVVRDSCGATSRRVTPPFPDAATCARTPGAAGAPTGAAEHHRFRPAEEHTSVEETGKEE